jgi:GWxTD domain-containing protein
MKSPRFWITISLLGPALACAAGDFPQTATGGPPDLPTRSLEPPIFYVDTTIFLGESGAPGVRVTFSVPYSQLHFSKREGGGYETSFELVAIFYDRNRRQVAGDIWRHQVTADLYRDTSSQRKTFSTAKEFVLPPGDYTLEVRMSSVGVENGSTAARRVQVSKPAIQAVALSAIEIGTCADSLAGSVDSERAGFVPSFTRRFGDPLPWVCARGEVFFRNLAGEEPIRLRLRVLGARDQVETEEAFSLPVAGARTAFTVPVPVRELGPGTYKVELLAERAGERAIGARNLEIDASRINIERNYDDYVELARYFLGDEEINQLRNVPEAERRERWEAFWKERDPDPDTPENERLDEFLSRVRTAADRYAARGEPGWRTDRGRVYIRYGEPDDIEQVAQGFNTPAYEIWRYVNRNLTFVFADSTGFGDFVLVQPSNSTF